MSESTRFLNVVPQSQGTAISTYGTSRLFHFEGHEAHMTCNLKTRTVIINTRLKNGNPGKKELASGTIHRVVSDADNAPQMRVRIGAHTYIMWSHPDCVTMEESNRTPDHSLQLDLLED